MCACSNYSSFDKILCYTTTTIWHYFISFSIHGINPVAETLPWESIGIKLIFYKIIIHPANSESGPASWIASTWPLSKTKLKSNHILKMRHFPGESAYTPDIKNYYFQMYTIILLPPEVNHHVLLSSLCHDPATKIKHVKPIQGQDPVHRLWGYRNSWIIVKQPTLVSKEKTSIRKKRRRKKENFITLSTFIFTKQLIKSL